MKKLHVLIITTLLGVALSAPSTFGKVRFQTLYTISGGNPVGLTAGNGALYGATYATLPMGANCGTIFELQPPATGGSSWIETVLYSFTGLNGDACSPLAAPLLGSNGALYGATAAGGANSCGAIYEMQPPKAVGGAWTETTLYSCGAPGIDGIPSALVLGPGGSLYVTTIDGGTYGGGMLLQLQPPKTVGGAWTETTLYNFPVGLSAGGGPTGLITGANGSFYGTILFGGAAPTSAGAVFQLTPPASGGGMWTETLLYNFQGGNDGSSPNSLIEAGDGTLYGTTFGTTYIGQYVGPRGVGTVFHLTPPATPGGAWTKTILRQFGQGNFCGPDSPLIMRSGNLFGTSCLSNGGVVFELAPPATPGGAWTTIYFHRFTNAEEPLGSLVMNRTGTIYGVAIPPVSQQPAGSIYAVTTH